MTSMEFHDATDVARLSRLSSRILILTFVLMTLGSVVRGTNSGLACPDWPMCFGQLIPAMDIQIFLEWLHRLVALILGVLLLRVAWVISSSKRLRTRYAREMLGAGLLFVFQCVLGGLTVIKLLSPVVVSSHLLNALLFFSLLLWIWRSAEQSLRNYRVRQGFYPNSLKMGFSLFTALVFVQLALGSVVAANYAGLVCPDFPTCHGRWLPSHNFLLWAHMLHRYVAYLVFGVALVMLWLLRHRPMPSSTAFALRSLPLLLVIQMILGVLNVFLALPVETIALHHANGVGCFALLMVATFDLYLGSPAARSVLGYSVELTPSSLRGRANG